MDDHQKNNLRQYLTAHRPEQFAFLQSLVGFNSENPPGECGDLARYLYDKLASYGFDVRRHPEPEDNAETPRTGLTNLIARRKFGDGPVIALFGHGDTAPAGGGWTSHPQGAEISEGKMHGRGVVQAKGAIAAYVFAATALAEVEADISGAVEIHITFTGETGGGPGCRWLLANMPTTPDMAIGAGPLHSLITSSMGKLVLEVEVRGKSAPAYSPESGNDALQAAQHVMAAVYAERENLSKQRSRISGMDSPTMVVTRMSGGEASASVAGSCKLTIDRRLIPEEDPALVERSLTSLIGRSVVSAPGIVCTVRRSNLSRAMTPGDSTSLLVDAFNRHAPDVLGHELTPRGAPMDTDGRHYSDAGVATVLFGVSPDSPADAGVGGPDEVLDLDDLRKSTELLSRVLGDLLS